MDPARPIVRVGLACVAAGVVAAGWALLARQAPGSPWHVGGLPSAIDRVAGYAWVLGVTSLVLASRVPVAWMRWTTLGASLGAVLVLGSLAYGAIAGVAGVQFVDPIGEGRAVLLVRLLGEMVLLGAAFPTVRSAWRGESGP